MERSEVFRELNFLFRLRNAGAHARHQLLQQITAAQIDAIAEIMRRLVARSVNIYRLDVFTFEDKRLTMRAVASSHVNRQRKKNLLQRNQSLIVRVLRPQYIYQTIAAEIRDRTRVEEE